MQHQKFAQLVILNLYRKNQIRNKNNIILQNRLFNNSDNSASNSCIMN